MTDLTGKVAVITGGASGIGASGVEVFVEAGAQVVAADLQDDKGAALVARFGADKVAYQHCDVTDMKALEALMQSAVDTFGGLDVLWNNAGSGGTSSSVEELDIEGYSFTMDLLLKSVFAGTHFAVPHMKARGAYVEHGGEWHTAPAPRFSRTPGTVRSSTDDGEQVVATWGSAS